MKQFTSVVYRVLFIGSFVLAGLAVWEKLANIFGYTVLRSYTPGRLLEFAAIALCFVIALQLREIKVSLKEKGSGQKQVILGETIKARQRGVNSARLKRTLCLLKKRISFCDGEVFFLACPTFFWRDRGLLMGAPWNACPACPAKFVKQPALLNSGRPFNWGDADLARVYPVKFLPR